MTDTAILTGKRPADIGNAVSDLIYSASTRGMEIDEIVCIVVAVAADYARTQYGDRYLKDLAKVITRKASE